MLEFIIKRRVFISMLFTALTLLGYISYKNLSVELLPNVELPFLFVSVNSFREVDTQYMEKEAVIPLEGAIGTLEGIEKIESFVSRRNGRIIIYYEPDVNLKYAYLKLVEKIDAAKTALPEEFFVQVVKVDTEQLTNMFMNLQIRGGGGSDRIRHIFDKEIRARFESIDGIANVEVFGGQEKSVEIRLNEQAAKSYNITPTQIRSLILNNNQSKIFLGSVKKHQKEIFINFLAEYSDIQDLENIVVIPEIPIFLKDIAEINFDVKEQTSLSRVNGKEAVTVQLIHDGRANIIDLAHATYEVIEDVNDQFKIQDIEIVIQQNSAEYLEDNIDLITNLAITGGLIAVLILWFFLRNLKLVIVIALALPVSIFTAFNLFYAFDITLNSLTLVGMALAVGMLLDNSIVVLENIYRLVQKNKPIEKAVIEGTREVWRSIFAATLTTTTVFLPFIFASNFMIRTLGYHISVSIISTLLVSLVVALLLIPMIAYNFFSREQLKNLQLSTLSSQSRVVQVYTLLLKSTIRFPLRTIIWTIIVFFTSVILTLALSLAGQEETDSEDFNLYVTMPGGSTLQTTDIAVNDLESRLENIDEVEDVISQIYEEEAILTLKLKDEFESFNDLTLLEVKEIINDRVDDFRAADVSFEQPQSSSRFQGGNRGQMTGSFERLLGVGSQTESIIIKGRDFEIMRRIADDIQYQLEELSSVERVRSNVGRNRPEIHLLFNKDILNSYNVSLMGIASELSNFEDEVSVGVRFKQNDEEYEIMIQNKSLEESTIEDLRELPISSTRGGYFPLEQVSRIVYAEGQSGINRVNQEKQIEVSYRFVSEVSESNTFLSAARLEVNQLINGLEFPSGIAIETEESNADLSEFYFLIGVAALLIYMILAAVFESLINPFVIMFTIPLAAIGSLWAIIFTENSLLNANTLIGFLILLGIVVNNGIILIDFTRILRQRGFRRSRALLLSGRARLRPILITAITTIVAMMPLAMGKVEYVTSIAAPFAITVIGGLSLSTVFTLLFIPTVYSGIESMLNWFRRLDWRLQLIQGFLFLIGSLIIYFEIESIIWQFANLLLLLLIIPGITYFIQTSLRSARSKVISTQETITIHIKNLYKIYDQPGRFRREWQKGKNLATESKEISELPGWESLLHLAWHPLLISFSIYFIYFYIQSWSWVFLLCHLVYFHSLHFLKSVENVQTTRLKEKRNIKKLVNRIYPLVFWGLPAINLVIFYIRWKEPVTVLLIAVIWYSALLIYTTSNRLSRKLINVNKLKGRFSGIRKRYYRLIQAVPIIGKKVSPFKALNGVSLEIGSGMFGLLGPNGAGKTTLMRIICGILEQSYGSVYFNDIDAKEKREELQGLIGYLPQDFGTYENMTAFEFLSYQAILKNILQNEEREKRVLYVLSAVHMMEHKEEKIGSFSGGMKQRIGIAQTLLHLPRILVVDEPTAGLDPRERIRFRNLLVELSRDRIVIFSTHIIEDIASSCDKVAVLDKGSLKYFGDPPAMVKKAEGHVWQCLVYSQEFEKLRSKQNIIHHIKIGEKIRIRLLAEQKPLDDAISVTPTLEDSYLWLLSGNGEKN